MMRDMEATKTKENELRREKEMFVKEMRMNQERYEQLHYFYSLFCYNLYYFSYFIVFFYYFFLLALLLIFYYRFSEREEALNARLDEAHKIVDAMRTKFDADLEL